MTQTSARSDTASTGGMNQNVQEISLSELWNVVKKHKKLLAFLPLAVGALTLAGSFLILPSYTATGQLLPPQQQMSGLASLMGAAGGGLAGALGSIGGIKNPSEQWVGLLKSRIVADAIVERFKLQEVYETKYRIEARNILDENSKITAGKDGMIDIEVTDHSPERAADMANAYIAELQKLTNSLAITEASQRRLFFEKQLHAAKTNLVNAEVLLKQSGVSEDVLKTNPDAAVARIAQLQASIAALELKVSVMRGNLTERSPDLQQAQLELATLKNQLKTAEANGSERKAGSSEYVGRYRDFKYFETLYELMARQFELAKIDEARDGGLVQVVDEAEIPEVKSKPRRGLMTALATAIAFILILSTLLIRNANRREFPTNS